MSSMSPNEIILPVYFGPDSSLYGCHHLSADPAHSPAVLICQPTGHEYERCHRAMRQLAVQAVRKGMSAMRFDYYAAGDSAGECSELSLARMRLDTLQAIRQCCERTGAARLTLVGLRLGATLAAQLAEDCTEIESLVLYAPVFDGEGLIAQWQRDQQDFFARHGQGLLQPGEDEILGFRVSQAFRRELAQKFTPMPPGSSLKRVLTLIDDAEPASPLVNEWMDSFSRHGIEVTVETVESIAIWRREPMEAVVPIKTIRRIVSWIEEGSNA